MKSRYRHRTTGNRWRASLQRLVMLFMFAGMLAGLAACNDSGNGSGDSGEVLIALTDAPGDFETYTVDVVSLTLGKANGETVEALPVQTRVDFAQYTQMTEFLTAATVPSGIYTSASMVLDYSNADIQVEDESGNTIPASMIVDVDGNAVSSLELNVRLEDRNRLRIAPGIPANLTLDFDLRASNQVGFSTSGEATVTVEPFLLADVNLDINRPHRLRGGLHDVNLDESWYEVIVRPFYHNLNDQDSRFGTIRVMTTEETAYEIDQEAYHGTEGLQVLDTLPDFTATVAIGQIRLNPRRFEATQVYAGSSVPGGDLDAVQGNVIARSGNTLSVRGATLLRTDGSAIFRDTVTVTVADTTTVHRQHSRDAHSIADISVGQKVRVFGDLTNEDPADLQMDASQGHVGMLLTTLHGNAIRLVSIPEDPAPFMAGLQTIDRRAIDLFDFSGTGDIVDNDADPSAYEIDTGSLDLSSISDGAPIAVRGFVTPFGSAPLDFNARTIVDVSDVRANLGLSWDPATSAPFLDMSASGLTLNLQGHGMFHHVSRAGVLIDLASLGVDPVIVPRGDGEGRFMISDGEVVQLFTTFSSYVEALESRLANGGVIRGIRATGPFDDQSAILTVSRMMVRMP